MQWPGRPAPVALSGQVQGTVAPVVQEFALHWGLDQNAVTFLDRLPQPVTSAVLSGFDGNSKDGNVWGRLLAYTRQTWARFLGVDHETTNLLRNLSEEGQVACLTTFDPTGTKDGNVSRRLQGFLKKVIAQGGGARPPGALAGHGGVSGALTAPWQTPAPEPEPSLTIAGFLDRCGLDQSAAQLLDGLDEEARQRTFQEFDPSTSKDGNVFGRLEGYLRRFRRPRAVGNAIWRPHTMDVSMAVGARSRSLLPVGSPTPTAHIPVKVQQETTTYAKQEYEGDGTPDTSTINHFLFQCGLDASAACLLDGLSEDLLHRVITEFDPTGTKDGNVHGRLEGYVRGLRKRRASEEGHARNVRTRPAAHAVVSAFPVGTTAHSVAQNPTIANFLESCGLEPSAGQLLEGLSEEALHMVVTEFDPSGTKDGNVQGRLEGFLKRVAMHFRPVGSGSGVVAWQPGMPEAVGTWHQSAARTTTSVANRGVSSSCMAADPAIAAFLDHCGLDASAGQLLEGLSEDALQMVFTEFDPSGTKDGNVLGRLEGFLRRVAKKTSTAKQHPRGNVGPVSTHNGAVPACVAADPKVAAFLEHCGLDYTAGHLLDGLTEEGLSMVLSEFDPSGTKDGNVLGRLQGFLRRVYVRTSSRERPALQAPTIGAQRTVVPFSHHALLARVALNPTIVAFLKSCGLDGSAGQLLEGLSEEELQMVLTEFDPRGTKDGNVLGRLEGYLRKLARMRLDRSRSSHYP